MHRGFNFSSFGLKPSARSICRVLRAKAQRCFGL